MKVVFYASDKPREHLIAQAMKVGVEEAGDEFEIRRTAEYGEEADGNDRRWPGPSPDTDMAVFFGVKGQSRQLLIDHRSRGIPTLFLDKGYSREKGEEQHTKYTRVSINAAHPLNYMMKAPRTSDRADMLKIELKNRMPFMGGHILYCGSSQKYHDFYKLGDATTYAQKLFKRLRSLTERHFVYRPKPSWKDAVPIGGTSFSNGNSSIQDALRGCFCLITHGSSAALDAVIEGVPAITIGSSIARPVCETRFEAVNKPARPSDKSRRQWLNSVAYCQWTLGEFRDGSFWRYVKQELELLDSGPTGSLANLFGESV